MLIFKFEIERKYKVIFLNYYKECLEGFWNEIVNYHLSSPLSIKAVHALSLNNIEKKKLGLNSTKLRSDWN